MIGLNKWDLVADQPGLLKTLREDCTRLLPQVRGVSVVSLSGPGEGIDKLMQAVVDASEVWSRRVSTARINAWLTDALQRNPPPAVSGPAYQDPLRHPGEEPPRRISPCSATSSTPCRNPTPATSSTASARPSTSPARRSGCRCARPRIRSRRAEPGFPVPRSCRGLSNHPPRREPPEALAAHRSPRLSTYGLASG